jgi:2,3-bisphosphoglycerate-independent phosphoglycerate mutase
MKINIPQIALIVLDGWGYRENAQDNAIKQAKTPFFNHLWNNYSHSLLQASGLHVGLPDGQMGNSEIGHTTIGAGKIIDTDLVRIKKSIENKEFSKNPVFIKLFEHVKKHNSSLHIKGLLSNGGVHSHEEHLYEFLKVAKEAGVKNIVIHVFMDGRDTPPQSAGESLERLEKIIKELGVGKIATASGRFYAMDRDNNWDRLAKAEQAMFECKGHICQLKKPSQFVKELYSKGEKDELISPIVFLDENGKGYPIEKNDGIFFYNFRADRARMLSQKISGIKKDKNLYYVTLTEYEKNTGAEIAFPSIEIDTTLAKEISEAGFTQAHIAETEKFPHATYFLNGGVEKPYKGESHIMLQSHNSAPNQATDSPFTHDLMPKMKAKDIADKAIEEIEKGTNFIFINFANPDMVGHTANVPAIIEAIEEVDAQLKRVVEKLSEKNGISFITADHGNAETNIDPETGAKHTSHTINPVPAIITSKEYALRDGTLADIAPTILQLMKINIPKQMSGKSLSTPK